MPAREEREEDPAAAAMALTEALAARALALGFARAGVARAERLGEEAEHLRAWLAAGRHGEMSWMAQSAAVRADPRHPEVLPEARSVLVLAAPYARGAGEERIGPEPARVSRYARGRDYHNVVLKKVRKLASMLRAHGHAARASVDSLPVMERAWAQRAGVGFVGKNCCLIVPGLGSYVFLATVVTSAELVPDAPMAERCGSCRACLDACPTSAFAGPRELDARRCISYLTIEQRGAIPEGLRPQVGDWIFGCDVCQDVCPFNRTTAPPAHATAAFAPDPRWEAADAAALLAMDEPAFAAWARGSPLQRAGRAGMARNAAVVLGNRGTRLHLPVLRQAAAADPADTVREAAAWAVARIEGTSRD